MTTTNNSVIASIPWWNFMITTLPAPPTGINEGSAAPSPQSLQSATATLVDTSGPAYLQYLVRLYQLYGLWGNGGLFSSAMAAVDAGTLNTEAGPWPACTAAIGAPPTKSVTVTAIASWIQIFQINNMGGDADHSLQTRSGVTNSQSDTDTFSAEVGVSVEAGFGPVSATLSANFSVGQQTTRSISYESEVTRTTGFTIPGHSYVQIWQLQMEVQVGTSGSALTELVECYQTLAYPPSAGGADLAHAHAQVERHLALIAAAKK